MTRARIINRRLARKATASNAPAHSKQAAPPFFNFGAEQSFFSGRSPEALINRKCASCEKEDKVQKKETAASATLASAQTSAKIKSMQGGDILPENSRQFFEPKFSADFSDVKVHNDSAAHKLASSVNAKAFTYKNNIVFNKGQYDSQSESGKHLLAHELTHVVQQNSAVSKQTEKEEKVQRAPTNADFQIKGKDPDSELDDTIIRFGPAQTAVTGREIGKIKREAKKQKTVELNLNGFASEEGAAAENTKIVDARIKNVDNLLASAGHTGIRNKIPNITAGEGNSNYRSRRVVEIIPKFVAPGVLSVSGIDPCTTKSLPCATAVTGIVPLASQKVAKAITELSVPSAATAAQLSTFFGATPASTVQTKLSALSGEIMALTAAHDPAADCHKDACDDTCSKGALAYVTTAVAPAKMVFCESVMGRTNDERSEVFIHEALHATPGVMSKDLAYAHTRKILTLSDAEKLTNTDSYVMLIRMLHNPVAVPTAPPKDNIKGTTDPGKIDFAKKVIAFLEQWLIASKFTTGDLYNQVNTALTNAAGWQSPKGWYHTTMNNLSPLFGLTDPGTTSPFIVPKRDDKIRIAGIADRYLRMREVLHSSPITLTKVGSGAEVWSKELGNKVNIFASFFSKTEADAVKYLILLMLKSMGDVPGSLRASYVSGADKIRAEDGIGP